MNVSILLRTGFHRGGLRAAAVWLLALVLVGCTSRLVVVTEPAGALVNVSDNKGNLLHSGPSPLIAELAFTENGGERYVVQVQPTGPEAERYYSDEKAITSNAYALLANDGEKAKRLAFTLIEKDYVNIPVVEVVLTPQGQWVGVAAKSRSFKDIGEAGGVVPALVVDFGDNRGIQGMALSPDGGRIVYSEAVYERRLTAPGNAAALGNILGNTPGNTAASRGGVYTLKGANLRGINILGGGVQHITTEDFQDMFPSFTPDGSRILFSSNRRGDLLGILGIRANGRSGISDIYVNHRDGMVLKPTAASDGTVAFAVVNFDSARRVVTGTQIWTHYGPNEFPTQITNGREPAISPSGEQIAYINPADGNLWVIQADGDSPVQLTRDAHKIMERYRSKLTATERAAFDADVTAGYAQVAPYRYPSWTPDGRHILYTSMQGVDPDGRPNEDIWIIRADGDSDTGGQQLTTNGSADRFPLMSPDGQFIYFLSNRGESWAIWRVAYGPLE